MRKSDQLQHHLTAATTARPVKVAAAQRPISPVGAADRYEVTGVNYRAASFTDCRVYGGAYGSSFSYDDNFNHTTANFTDSLGSTAINDSNYDSNTANEYTAIYSLPSTRIDVF